MATCADRVLVPAGPFVYADLAVVVAWLGYFGAVCSATTAGSTRS